MQTATDYVCFKTTGKTLLYTHQFSCKKKKKKSLGLPVIFLKFTDKVTGFELENIQWYLLLKPWHVFFLLLSFPFLLPFSFSLIFCPSVFILSDFPFSAFCLCFSALFLSLSSLISLAASLQSPQSLKAPCLLMTFYLQAPAFSSYLIYS